MKYMLLTYESEEDFAARIDNERKEQYWAAWRSYFAAMKESGVLINPGNVLQSGNSARIIKHDNGLVEEQGPFADSKEQLSGYCVIDVPDFNQAKEWAGRAPSMVSGAVEIRPVW